MHSTINAARNPASNSILSRSSNDRANLKNSSISDLSGQFQEDQATQLLADSLQQRAQEDPTAFRNALDQAFTDKANPAQLDALAASAANGDVPLPENVQFVNPGSLGSTAMGAYDSSNGGTIYLDKRLLNDSEALEAVYTEEMGHHFDSVLGGVDAAGDEGAIFSQSLLNGSLTDVELQKFQSENDNGFINIDGKRVAVEFFHGYSGPGSSPGTGGSSSSSSSSSSYSGPGSSPGTGGSSNSSSSSSSASDTNGSTTRSSTTISNSSSSTGGSTPVFSNPPSIYTGPGSSAGTGGLAPEPEEESSGPSFSLNLPGPGDLLERDTVSGGNTQFLSRDFVYNPNSSAEQLHKRFERQYESDQFAPNANTIRINGGTSDEFRYNNSASQTHSNTRNFQIGDSVSGSRLLGHESKREAGDENIGASAEFNAGARGTVSAGASVDRNGVDLNVGAEGFVGVETKAEAHAGAGPVNISVSAEGQAGAMASAKGNISIDPRNGVAAQVGGELFAGAQVKLEASGELGDSVDASAGVDLKAGIGVEVSGDVELSLDVLRVDAEIGGALGIGADVSISVSVSPSGFIDDAGDAASAIKDIFNW